MSTSSGVADGGEADSEDSRLGVLNFFLIIPSGFFGFDGVLSSFSCNFPISFLFFFLKASNLLVYSACFSFTLLWARIFSTLSGVRSAVSRLMAVTPTTCEMCTLESVIG